MSQVDTIQTSSYWIISEKKYSKTKYDLNRLRKCIFHVQHRISISPF